MLLLKWWCGVAAALCIGSQTHLLKHMTCYHAGRWTVARFLQRHTGRPDVFTLDRHMRAAMRAIFPKQLQELQKGRQEDKVMEVLAVLVWPGHRTLAR
jgi:hypothetical protein